MVSSQRTVATIRPTYHKRQKSGAPASNIRRNGELLTRSFPPGDGLPRYIRTIGNQPARTSLFLQVMGVMSICLGGSMPHRRAQLLDRRYNRQKREQPMIDPSR